MPEEKLKRVEAMTVHTSRPRTSRQRYRAFVEDYRGGRLESDRGSQAAGPAGGDRGRRREYVRDYLRWLKPHRRAVAVVFLLAFVAAGLQMIEPLFMRFI